MCAEKSAMAPSLERLGGPNPVVPGRFVLADEARKARHRLYSSTLLYPAHFLVVLALSLRTGRYWECAFSVAAGLAAWTLMEYWVHRWILHGRFPDGPGLQHFLHRQFDHLHLEHHARPWDGNHVNGTLKDTLAPATVFMLAAWAAGPVQTWPLFVASLLLGYIMEEWVHHSVHYCNFKSRYFRYIRRHHLFHHSPRGTEVGYGLTSGLWDMIIGSRISDEDRRRLYGTRAALKA